MEIGVDTFVASSIRGLVDKDEDAMENLLERICHADQAGLDVYGIGEHHGADMLDSAPTVILGAAAARTNRIRLTSAVTGVGTCDPVRLYQQFATIDLISRGRAEIVAGRGASPVAWPLFGMNIKDSKAAFIEKLELLLKIRDNETVSWSGDFRAPIEDISIYPRSVQEKIPVWHAVLRTPASAIRAGEMGLPLMIAVIDGQIGQSKELVELYRLAGKDAGFSEDQLKVGFHSMGYVAETRQEAIDDFYPGWAESMKKHHAMPKTRSRFDLDLNAQGSSLVIGGPEEAAEKILEISESIGGISRFCFQMDYADLPHEKLMKSIELIGTKVIPIIQERTGQKASSEMAIN